MKIIVSMLLASTVLFGCRDLEIKISGLPPGADARVTVTGPSGYNQTVTSTSTLTGLPAGNYKIKVSKVRNGDTIYCHKTSGSPAIVSFLKTAQSSVKYTDADDDDNDKDDDDDDGEHRCGPPVQTAATGGLQVTVSGLPAGVNAQVTVTGPNGYTGTVTTTTTLNNLALGSYTIGASAVTSGIATYNATVTGSPATVTAGTVAQSSVTYTVVSGNLQINVSGLGTINANITVNGPNGYTRVVTGTVTLASLTPGTYTVAANNVPGTSYTYGGTVTGSPATVSSSSTAAVGVNYAPISGALAITITGLPTGTNANLLVTGPGGYSQQVTASGTLTNLVPGTYTVSVNPARVAGTMVDQVFSGTGSSAAVSAGATASTSVAYSPRPGAGKLWLPRNASVIGYDESQISSTGSPAPAVTTQATGLNEAVAFDCSGNKWVSSRTTNMLYSFTPAQIAASGSPTPAVTISASATGDSLYSPTGLAFDRGGNLWVANYGSSKVVKYASAQLSATGNPAPPVVISAVVDSLYRPAGLAFDSAGNLWVANSSSYTNTIVKFTTAQLASTGSPAPSVTLSASAGSLNQPFGLAFDGSGNLWIANLGNNTVVKFTSAQLASSGSPAPSVILSASAGSLNGPSALAFDNGGNLWVANTTAQMLVKFGTSQLAASGAPVPPVTISALGSTDMAAFSFNPPPASLPLFQ